MPQQTLEWVKKPQFCRAVQNLFLDAIEGDGSATLSADSALLAAASFADLAPFCR